MSGTPFYKSRFFRKYSVHDVICPKTGRLIVKEGRKLTKGIINEIQGSGINLCEIEINGDRGTDSCDRRIRKKKLRIEYVKSVIKKYTKELEDLQK